MRKMILLLALCALAPCLRADDATLQARAQDAYAKGEYAQALHLYDSLCIMRSSAALFYNIGNCHMKLGDIPNAVLYYERAIRLQPGADDIQANLDQARSKVVDRVNELPALTLGSAWDKVRGGKDVDQWARRSLWACLITAMLAIACVVLRSKTLKRMAIGAGVVVGLFTITATAFAYFRKSEVTDRSEAIIMSPKVDVRGEPREGSTTVFVLHEGTKVVVLQEQNGWTEIRLGNGSVGWAAPGTLAVI